MNNTTTTLYRLTTDSPDEPTVDYDTLQKAMTIAQETHDEWIADEWWLKETLVWEAPAPDQAHLLLQAHTIHGGWWGIEAITPDTDPEGVEVPDHVIDHIQNWLGDDDGLFDCLQNAVHYAMECIEDWDLPEMHDLDVYVAVGKRTLDLSD